MSTVLSRRAFITLTGATLITAALPGIPAAAGTSPAAPVEPLIGRALGTVAVYPGRDPYRTAMHHLWPDSTTTILDEAAAWFRVPLGFVRRSDLQPMLAYDPARVVLARDLPAWVHVAAPVAPVRAWAAAAAPLVTRIGNGGVLCVVDRLRDDAGTRWYAVATGPDALEPLGWTQAARWSLVDVPAVGGAGSALHLRLDVDRAVLEAIDNGGAVLLRVPATPPAGEVLPGNYALAARRLTALHAQDGYYGAGWQLEPDGLPPVYGAYWHNRFGDPAVAGIGWSVPPVVAQWLYRHLPADAPVLVVKGSQGM